MPLRESESRPRPRPELLLETTLMTVVHAATGGHVWVHGPATVSAVHVVMQMFAVFASSQWLRFKLLEAWLPAP